MSKKILATYKDGILIPKMPLEINNNSDIELIIPANEGIYADEKVLAENWMSEEDKEAWKDL